MAFTTCGGGGMVIPLSKTNDAFESPSKFARKKDAMPRSRRLATVMRTIFGSSAMGRQAPARQGGAKSVDGSTVLLFLTQIGSAWSSHIQLTGMDTVELTSAVATSVRTSMWRSGQLGLGQLTNTRSAIVADGARQAACPPCISIGARGRKTSAMRSRTARSARRLSECEVSEGASVLEMFRS